MVHGQRKFRLVVWNYSNFNWTNGCTLTNSKMDEFMDLVKVGTKIQIEW